MDQIRNNHNTLSPYIQKNRTAIKFKYVTYEHFVIELQQKISNQKLMIWAKSKKNHIT